MSTTTLDKSKRWGEVPLFEWSPGDHVVHVRQDEYGDLQYDWPVDDSVSTDVIESIIDNSWGYFPQNGGKDLGRWYGIHVWNGADGRLEQEYIVCVNIDRGIEYSMCPERDLYKLNPWMFEKNVKLLDTLIGEWHSTGKDDASIVRRVQIGMNSLDTLWKGRSGDMISRVFNGMEIPEDEQDLLRKIAKARSELGAMLLFEL